MECYYDNLLWYNYVLSCVTKDVCASQEGETSEEIIMCENVCGWRLSRLDSLH